MSLKRVVTSTFGALSNPLLFKALARRFALGRVNVVYYHYVGDTVSYSANSIEAVLWSVSGETLRPYAKYLKSCR